MAESPHVLKFGPYMNRCLLAMNNGLRYVLRGDLVSSDRVRRHWRR